MRGRNATIGAADAHRVARLGADPAIERLRSAPLALVLSGGGAKGAYEAGVITCLTDLRIGVHRVAGSSVGALNALAVAAGRGQDVGDLWARLRRRDVFRASPRAVTAAIGYSVAAGLISNNRLIGLYAGLLVALVLVLVGFFLGGLLSIAAVAAGCVLALVMLTRGERRGHRVAELGWRVARHVHPRASFADQSHLRRTLSRFVGTDLDVGIPCSVTVAEEARWWDPDDPTFAIEAPGPGDGDIHLAIDRPVPRPGWLPRYVDVSGLPRDEVLARVLQSSALPVVFRHAHTDGGLVTDGGLADNVPLQAIDGTAVATAIVVSVDPRVRSHSDLAAHRPRVRRGLALRDASAGIEDAPSGNPLYRSYRTWLAELLRGLVDGTRPDDRDYRVRPRQRFGFLKEFDQVDVLVSLRLATLNRIGADYYRDNGAEDWRLFHRSDLPRPDGSPLFPAPPPSSPADVLLIAPSKPLGGLLTGTLGFSRRRLRRSMRLGYQDALHALESLGNGG